MSTHVALASTCLLVVAHQQNEILHTNIHSGETYVVSSKCSRNHFISKEYKTVQSFKLHFLLVPFVLLYTLLQATFKALETFLEAILCKPFQLLRRTVNDVSSITKAPSLQC